jgi:hypothetical protein
MVTIAGSIPATAQTPSNRDTTAKQLYIPAKIYRIPENNDYNNNESEYSYQRMVQSDNIAIFWNKEFGNDPGANPDEKKRFNTLEALKELERFYTFYVNNLKLVQKGNSLSDKYKILLFVIGGTEGTAFGGGIEDKVGALWTPATRMNKAPYGALAHELGHSFQFLARADNGRGPRGAIMEMSAQYLLWQVYPEWMTFENYHLVDFMKNTHYAFLHPINMYHSPYVLEYWSHKRGIEFFGNLCRATQEGEDPVMTYQRITQTNQQQFNDEIFDAARRFITWDMPRIEKAAHQYANQHTTSLQSAGEDWYKIAPTHCPQNYGYNGIKLRVPAAGTKIKLAFKGIAGAAGYSTVKTDRAGWRYGFVASLKDGSRVYSKVFSDANGTASFKVPRDTEYLWLVVSGAPTEHWPVTAGRQRNQNNKDAQPPAEEQWPYQIKLSGTAPDESVIK